MMSFAQRSVHPAKPAGWQMWKMFAGAADAHPHSSQSTSSVRLIWTAHRPPQTPVEAQIVSVLASQETTVSYHSLVQFIADDLYRKELRRGGANLDIGLFGSRLFDGDVISVLESADGILWEITGEQKT